MIQHHGQTRTSQAESRVDQAGQPGFNWTCSVLVQPYPVTEFVMEPSQLGWIPSQPTMLENYVLQQGNIHQHNCLYKFRSQAPRNKSKLRREGSTSICERSAKASTARLVFSLGSWSPTPWPEVIRAAAGSLGGGGRGDLIFPVPLGGGARALGFLVTVVPPDSPAAESMPVPLDGLFFTFIRMVSPS